jgi:CRISPR-associated protein Cas1
MRKLLNTVYITSENAYLTLHQNNIVCSLDGKKIFSIPFDNVENIVCFSYLGCSPELMGKCVEKVVPINFVSPNGKFWAKVCGETKGNVFLRIQQIDKFRQNALKLARNEMAAKFHNTAVTIKRTQHDHSELRNDEILNNVLAVLKTSIEKAEHVESIDSLLGIEGKCANAYFNILPKLITGSDLSSTFKERSRRPPLDPVNALLSFLYMLVMTDCAAALETVGLDSYIGFYHSLRSGRVSLACDIEEEFRCIADRMTITLLNLKVLTEKDFERQLSGAVWLNKEGKRKAIAKWQEKKRESMYHPVIKEKIPYGLLPYVQANLLAKYVRGDLETYIPFLMRQS